MLEQVIVIVSLDHPHRIVLAMQEPFVIVWAELLTLFVIVMPELGILVHAILRLMIAIVDTAQERHSLHVIVIVEFRANVKIERLVVTAFPVLVGRRVHAI